MHIRTLLTRGRLLLPPAAAMLAAAACAGGGSPAAAGPGASAASPHAVTAAACTTWQVVTTPRVPDSTTPPTDPTTLASLESVSALTPGDAWITGRAGMYPIPGWVLHWNGRALAKQPQPDLALGAGTSFFTASLPGSFDSDTDGWQVIGDESGNGSGMTFDDEATFAERWHGGQWTQVPMAVSPDPATEGIRPYAVAAISPSNAWMAGAFYAIGEGNVFGVTAVGTVLEHWDGTQWTIVPNPAQDQAGAGLSALSVASPTSIWAVGFQGDTDGQTQHPLIEHWDGRAWSVVQAPSGEGASELASVSADGPGDAWAVGYQDSSNGYTGAPLVEHWNGSTWAAVTPPSAGSFDAGKATLGAVYAASPSDVWAGVRAVGNIHGNVLMHWDGTSWASVPVGPQEYGLSYSGFYDGEAGGINALGGTGPGDVWAVGSVVVGGIPAPLAAHLSCGTGGSHA